ncbi:hypothetical protein GCM10019016_015520 [Streptomyces prasinosporus]|uniref:Uncharacterized protein n=1 Tax=Streptomyces prasinosporus TaxID=68256 RepID=A0ABP6TGW3_9ACTN|nr:hypothetical protein GCM10010332_10400 [Streptomyces albogriseolus]
MQAPRAFACAGPGLGAVAVRKPERATRSGTKRRALSFTAGPVLRFCGVVRAPWGPGSPGAALPARAPARFVAGTVRAEGRKRPGASEGRPRRSRRPRPRAAGGTEAPGGGNRIAG